MKPIKVTHKIFTPTAGDAAAISAFAHASFIHSFGHLYRPQDLQSFLSEWNHPEILKDQIADPQWALAAHRFTDGSIAGFIKCGPLDLPLPDDQPTQRATEIHQLYVHENAKGTGLAAALMEFAIAWAKKRADILYLSVFNENFRAQKFYARYGFTDVGRNPFRVGDHIDEDRIWRADL